MVLDHVEERFENSRGKRDRRSIQASKKSFGSVELKLAEFVNVTGRSLHRSFQIIQKKFSGGLKTFINGRAKLTTRESAHASRVDKTQ